MSNFYIKPYTSEFGKKIRVYVPPDAYSNGDTFVSLDLIEAINPDLIRSDESGLYASLTLCFGRKAIKHLFSIIDTGGNDIQMSGQDLANLMDDDELDTTMRIYET